jgi:hypothetical protein
MLTEVGIGQRRGGEVTSVRSGGEEVTGARGGGRRGALWASWYFGQRRTQAVKVVPGLRGRRCAGKGELRRCREQGNVGGYSNPSGGEAVQGFVVRWRGCCGSGWLQGAAADKKRGLVASACGSAVQRTPSFSRFRYGPT